MDRLPASRADSFTALIEWIETQLREPLTLEQVAARAGLSPYHFSRLFTARMGRSVMAYVRGRRLVHGAQRLATEPGLRLVDLAFDCGFESQEAFTRAFKRAFGVSPGRFRDGVSSLHMNPFGSENSCAMTLDASAPRTSVVQLPGLVRRDAFTVCGPSRRFDQASKSEIPNLWTRLMAALPFDGQAPTGESFGVSWSVDRAEGSFEYMAGVQLLPGAAAPQGFTTLQVPAATYAVFRITLAGGEVHPQVKQAMDTMWCELIPQAGLQLAGTPDFEHYDGRFDPAKPGAIIEVYVPVVG